MKLRRRFAVEAFAFFQIGRVFGIGSVQTALQPLPYPGSRFFGGGLVLHNARVHGQAFTLLSFPFGKCAFSFKAGILRQLTQQFLLW